MTIELDEVVERLAGEAAAGEGVEAYAEQVTRTGINAFEGEVERLTSASSTGVGVRVVRDGRLGYAYTADLSGDGLRQCLAEARANLDVSTEDPGNVLPAAASIEPLDGLFDPRQVGISPQRKVQLALDLEARTRAANPKVTKVETASYGDAVVQVAIASSNGVRGSLALTRAWCYSTALATEDGQSQMGFGIDTARSIEDLDIGPVAAEAAERAVRLLGATKPPTRTVPVVLDRMVAPSLIGVLLAGLSAEAVQKRRSLFADKLGERVGAAGLNLVDDGRLLDGPGATPFDDEGVPTRRNVLLEDGVLQRFLHNTASAAREGATSTGNASRGSFKTTPGISAHNVFFEPGDKDQAGLLAQAGEGLLVQDMTGVHSGANPITGDFSVGVSGLWFRNGELAEPVREATVAAHLLDILEGIVAVGSDLRWTTGSVGGSSLLIGQMTVAGA
ncbi:MAG TPA: TldD/PmbA family protein [Actinomycetota bacterium]|jgi:PmbA protein|nr:TldD/PmbA family protein [Actinomycetota bacterium]